MKPNIKPKPKIGRDKFKEVLKKFPNIGKKEITLLSIPKQIIDISFERYETFSKISLRKKEEALLKISKKRNIKIEDLTKKPILFHTQIYRPEKGKISNGSAIPSSYYFFKSMIHFTKIKQKYQVIAVVNNKGNIIGYTTIKVNQLFMKRVNEMIVENSIKNKITLTESRDNFLRYFMYLLNNKETITKKRDNYKIDLYKFLESTGFEIHFTPEEGYRLDRNFNFVADKK
jgi:hypothetical protein